MGIRPKDRSLDEKPRAGTISFVIFGGACHGLGAAVEMLCVFIRSLSNVPLYYH